MNTSPIKKRHGLQRVWYAAGYSFKGLRAGWHEPAFRQELLLSLVLIPLALVIARQWLEAVALIGTVVLVMITELLNTAVESVVDRVGPEWHELSGRAKDMGSAAVLLSLLLCGGVWVTAVVRWWWY
ncbi:diacylglycerol kinase [Hydrogenophaga sp.]|uniref:diacylglycerol kinase n=1 Tax=Hydrogenophaga sp. TaxID=1904254 RepID=UPI0035AEB17A